ncbi:hypothetical protein NLA05_21390 [Xanthomonas citri pv. anacardii]|uniref:hypothetical protein n=1 Tax=Xanthomonas citri TaxID=346 RepID=UPI0011AFC5C0|nr:hypothetical protein [Xanthomonas citri]MCT8358786.1 hypothetical protein [Xanthomonas citri pv. anacardii]MCT8362825.1 hypothetical protein [Xanthomonas citri pv. anacardii]MCT8366856.1 hypothetical protein [Xanthomonas citri pv. anacardii]MCT8370883.1 hypothetical protein [Xanthomonas citri pv. anacardii]MCT8374919.1 hypothetical protein [Xanthomonas citri pv. anacardii]
MKTNFLCEKGVVGPLRSGMQRAEVRCVLGGYNEFKKSPFSQNTTDEFLNSGLHVFYSPDELIKGVELFPDVGALFKGDDLFSFKLAGLMKFLDCHGIGYKFGDVGIKIVEVGIRIYSSDMNESCEASIESVYIEL